MPETTTLVAPPHRGDHSVSLWLDEQIWGHRLWDAQSPWLLCLEFLNIAEGCRRQGKLLQEGADFEPVSYKPYRRMFLRNILFNNDKISEINERFTDSAAAWAAWLAWMAEQARAVSSRDFSYLKTHFHCF